MNVSVTGPFIYFTIPIFGGINVTQTMLSSTLVAALLCCAFVWIGKRLKKRPDGVQVLVEKCFHRLSVLFLSYVYTFTSVGIYTLAAKVILGVDIQNPKPKMIMMNRLTVFFLIIPLLI